MVEDENHIQLNAIFSKRNTMLQHGHFADWRLYMYEESNTVHIVSLSP